MNNDLYTFLVILICSLTTIFLRYVPIIFFRNGKVPKVVTYLGGVLPFAIMPILVMYCIKDTAWTTLNSVLPMIAGIATITVFHLWKKNTVLSLITGLTVYIALIHLIP